MVLAKSQTNNIWIEITKSEHKHGGKGWEFGTCLWSPSRNKAGVNRYRIMKEPEKGDLVLHFYKDHWSDGKTETRISGHSIVKKECIEIDTEPPSAGSWASMTPYYRIDLQAYSPFPNQLSLREIMHVYGHEIRREIIEAEPKFYPYNTYRDSIATVQGIYLAKCTQRLYLLFKNALAIGDIAKQNDGEPIDPQTEYSEALCYSREKYFWARNGQLAKRAKDYYGLNCQVCGFNFGEKYGELARGYIECHHIDPLSEKAEKEWREEIKTNITQVTILCANCHRVAHRKRPALKIETLKDIINR